MDATDPVQPFSIPHRPEFPPTRWSLVLAVQEGDGPRAAAALGEICRAYWYPLYAYARRCGVSPADSEDLVQGFFASFLQNKGFCRVDAAQGRLRSYLLASFRYFQSTESRSAAALKRGGAIRFESLEIPSDDAERRYCQEPVEVMDPAKLFDRRWILDLVERSVDRLSLEFQEGDGPRRFAVLRTLLYAGSRSMTSAEAAAALGITVNAVNVAVFDLRQRLQGVLRQEILRTCASPADFEEELRFILNQWSS